MEQHGAYHGLRVLDLTGPAGAYAGKLFAGMGADVLKVEPPEGDPGRWVSPFAGQPGPNTSLHWWYHNAGKRSVVIDLTSTEGRARFEDLAASADVLIDTFPSPLQALGITFEDLQARNPRLIYASVTPFGLTGPRANWKATDVVASALGGLLYLGGLPELPPSWPGGEQSYLLGACATAVGVAMALVARDRTGRGQRVSTSLQEATMMATENALGFWNFRRFIRQRLGTRSFARARMIYEAKDGWLVSHIGGRWDSLLDWIAGYGYDVEPYRGEAWVDPRYRLEHFLEFEETLIDFLSNMPKEQAYEEGQQRRMVMGPVRNIAEAHAEPQLVERDYWVNMPTPIGAVAEAPGAPYKFSDTPWRVGGPAPALGDNVEGWAGEPARQAQIGGEPDEYGRLPLHGIRIVDFGTNVIVPLTCKLLASYGAEIIKIDSRTHPDGQRNTPVPRPEGYEDSLNSNWLFLNSNSDKRSIGVNLTVPAAQDLVRRIIAKADIVIDNFGVDPMPKWGMSTKELFEMKPDLIQFRASVMGRTGSRRNYVGLGNSIMGAAGLSSITGFEGVPPVSTCTAHPDYSSNAHHALFAILTALYHRNRTGKGQYIDMSQTESTMAWLGPTFLDYTVNGIIDGPTNNRHPQIAPHGVYRCAGEDRWIAIACPTDAEWQTLAGMIDPKLAAAPRFATIDGRKTNEDDLDACITNWTKEQDPFALMEKLQAAGVPAGVAQTSQDILERDEHIAAREFILTQQHEEAGEVKVMQPHFRLSDTPGRVVKPAPLLGQDNDWVMQELLALNDEDVANLYIEGAIE